MMRMGYHEYGGGTEVPKKKFEAGYVVFPILGIILLLLLCSLFKVVSPGHTGVVIRLGRVLDSPLSEGFHFKYPWDKVEEIDNRILKMDLSTESSSSDMQTVTMDISVNYRVDKSHSNYVYQNVGSAWQEIIVSPAVPEYLKTVVGRYTAEDCVKKRDEISKAAKEALDGYVKEHGIHIEAFSIKNIQFTPEYNEAIEKKQVAEQDLQRSKTEQEKAVVEANTEAQKKTIAAQAEADAKKLEAEGNAALAASLSDNVVNYLMINKWNGELPKVAGESGVILSDSLFGSKDNTNQ